MSAAPSSAAERVLGIDSGSRVTGWGVIEVAEEGPRLVACGTLRLNPDAPISQRLKEIHQGLLAILREFQPTVVAVEEAFAGRNLRSAIRLAEARAVCLLAAELEGRRLAELPPALVKKAVTGHGRAAKDDVRRAVLRILDWEEESAPPAYDASDALAVALCAMIRQQVPDSLQGPSLGRPGRRKRRWTQSDLDRLQEEGQQSERAP